MIGREITMSKLLKRLLSIWLVVSGGSGVASDARYALTAAITAWLLRLPMLRDNPGIYCVIPSTWTVENALKGSELRICQMMPSSIFQGREVDPLVTSECLRSILAGPQSNW